MKRYRDIGITFVLSVLMHFIFFYLSPFHISADVPEKKEVRIVFKIKEAAKKKVVPVNKKVLLRQPISLTKKIVPLKKKIITRRTVKLARTPSPVRKKTESRKIMRAEKIRIKPHMKMVGVLIARAERHVPPAPEPVTESPEEEMFRFNDLVRNKIEQEKVYPMVARRMGINGDVYIGFTILPDGSVSDIEILSGIKVHKLLKRAAVATIERAAPYLPVPALLIKKNGIRIKLKIAYKLT